VAVTAALVGLHNYEPHNCSQSTAEVATVGKFDFDSDQNIAALAVFGLVITVVAGRMGVAFG